MRVVLTDRRLAFLFACLALMSFWPHVSTSNARPLYSALPDPYPEAPHVAPLALVLASHRSTIDKLELPGRTSDTEVREWLIRRPVSSGHQDGRFFFVVGYRIGSRVVGEWGVDTKTGVVTPTSGFFN